MRALKKGRLCMYSAGAVWLYDDAYVLIVPNDEAVPKKTWQVDFEGTRRSVIGSWARGSFFLSRRQPDFAR